MICMATSYSLETQGPVGSPEKTQKFQHITCFIDRTVTHHAAAYAHEKFKDSRSLHPQYLWAVGYKTPGNLHDDSYACRHSYALRAHVAHHASSHLRSHSDYRTIVN
jgi:hypothetical protein